MRVILTALLVLFTSATASTYSAAEIPLTSDGHGGTVRWVDEGKTGIKIPVGTTDTLICDPRLLAIAATKGISLGDNCIRLFNDELALLTISPLRMRPSVILFQSLVSVVARKYAMLFLTPGQFGVAQYRLPHLTG